MPLIAHILTVLSDAVAVAPVAVLQVEDYVVIGFFTAVVGGLCAAVVVLWNRVAKLEQELVNAVKECASRKEQP